MVHFYLGVGPKHSLLSRFSSVGLIWSSIRLVTLLTIVLASTMPASSGANSARVGPKTFYLALGDAGAFGYQPNGDWTHGYADQWFVDLHSQGVETMVNYACMGEDSTSFIHGGCPFGWIKRSPYVGSQLSAAVNFIRAHPGQVSPVSIDVSADDMLPSLWPRRSCNVVDPLWKWHLAVLDRNLTRVIFPVLVGTLTGPSGQRTGDLIMINNFSPGQNQCPDDEVYMKELNAHLAADAALFNVPVADVYSVFNSEPVPNDKLCELTWICVYNKVGHATGGQPGEPGNGYGVEAHVLEETMGY